MRTLVGSLILGLSVVGCASDGSSRSAEARPAPAKVPAPTAVAKKNGFTKDSNPTTTAGRGEPSLDDAQRPAAWLMIDGSDGKFTERDGNNLIQWVIEKPASDEPTFRVEGYEPLMGDARDFKCVLRSVDSTEGTDFLYGIAAKPGTFQTGRDYSLLNPGDDFVIRNGWTGDVVREIAPLPAGTYAIAAGLENASTGKKAAAVTYFTVAGQK